MKISVSKDRGEADRKCIWRNHMMYQLIPYLEWRMMKGNKFNIRGKVALAIRKIDTTQGIKIIKYQLAKKLNLTKGFII